MVLKDGARCDKSKGYVVDRRFNSLINMERIQTSWSSFYSLLLNKELEWNDSAVEGAYRIYQRFCLACWTVRWNHFVQMVSENYF